MKSLFHPLLFMVFLLLCTSCRDKPISDESSEEQLEKTQVYEMFLINVNDLRVRSAPGQKSEVTDKLKEGMLVHGSGNVSELTDIITLRNVTYDEPYHMVQYDGKEGWVYGGAILCLYRGSKEAPFTSRIMEAAGQMRLAANEGKIESGGKILSVLSQFKGSEPEWNDALFMLGTYYMSHLEVTLAMDDSMKGLYETSDLRDEIAQGTLDMEQSEVLRRLKINGFKLTTAEGDVYPTYDRNTLTSAINGPFTLGMEQAIRLRNRNETMHLFSDGGITTDLVNIADMAISLEKLSKNHPLLPLSEWVDSSLDFYLNVILNGTDNSPSVNYESGKYRSEFISMWEYYLTTHPHSAIAGEIKERLKK